MSEDIRELYYVMVSAMVPSTGTETISARSIEHAKELITEKYKTYKDFKVVDVFKLKDCPEIIQATQSKEGN